MIAEIALVVAGAALLLSNIKAKNTKQSNTKLLAENSAMAESLFDGGSPFQRDPDEPWYQHDWTEPERDVLYTSKLPWSYDQVLVNVAVCRKCQTVHRYIVSGTELAKQKGLQVEEGFYYSGLKISNQGCPFPDKKPFAQLPEWHEVERLDEEKDLPS